MSARRLVGWACLALLACGSDAPSSLPPLGQVVLYVDTDAPLPAAAGDALGPDDPLPLFDRLRLELYRPGETSPCADCTHEFDVDRALFRERRASIGVTPPVGASGYVVRARLFKAAHTNLGEPRPGATLETVALLPPIAAEGVTPVTIVLRADEIAHPVGSIEAPVQAIRGAPSASLVGTWPGSQRVACEGEPADDEVCVPGGAYWMGNPRSVFGLDPSETAPVRLAALSPFFLRTHEVTVEELKRSGLSLSKTDPIRYDPTNGAGAQLVRCTYQDVPADNARLPVTCLSWETAERYCELIGGTLPSEAQYQYVASAFVGRAFVWGEEPPACADAVYARTNIEPDFMCPGAWIDTTGSARLDRLLIGGKEVVDLAGNVTELALDLWNLSTESCWGSGVFRDPVCANASAVPGMKAVHTRVGGSFVDPAAALAAATRRPYLELAKANVDVATGGRDQVIVASTGFRCARPGLSAR